MMTSTVLALTLVFGSTSPVDVPGPQIEGGGSGTFYSAPWWMDDTIVPDVTTTPGNSTSYVKRVSLVVPDGWIVYRDGVETNVPPPRLSYDNDARKFVFDMSDSHVLGDDRLYGEKFYFDNIDVRDLSWRTSDYGPRTHRYYAVGTNFTELTLDRPIYSLKAIRADERLLASVISTLEANRERLHFASMGETIPAIEVNNDLLMMSHRMYGLNELLRQVRDSAVDRAVNPPGLVRMPGGILEFPRQDAPDGYPKVLHWWSSTLFDLDDSYDLLPTFDWSRIVDVKASFTNSAVCFMNYGFMTSPETWGPMKPLLFVGSLDDEYKDPDLLPAYFPPDGMPYFMTNFFPWCLQSRGAWRVSDDAYETWYGLTHMRKLPMELCGINQLLAMQDRTIHIPDSALEALGHSTEVKRTRFFDGNGSASVRYDLSSGSWTASEPSLDWHVSQTTQEVYTSSRGDFHVFLYCSRTKPARSVSISGSKVQVAKDLVVLDQVAVSSLIEEAMRDKDVTSTNYIHYSANAYVSANEAYVDLDIDGCNTRLFGPFEIDGPFEVPVNGSSYYRSEYTVDFTTNVSFAIQATQPGAGCWSRAASCTLGTFSALRQFYDDYGTSSYEDWDEKLNLCKTQKATYKSRQEISSRLVAAAYDVRNKMVELCPVDDPLDFVANAPLPDDANFYEIDGSTVIFQGNGEGYFRVVNYRRRNESIEISFAPNEGGARKTLPAGIVDLDLHVSYDVSNTYVLPGCPRESFAKGKVTPITQVDWSWKNMKLIKDKK